MKAIPKMIHVGGKKIRIVIKPDLDEWGSYHHDLAEIWISSRSLDKRSTLRETLRHEIMHASLAISGIAFMERFEEEAIVRCFDDIFFPAWERIQTKLQ